MSTSKIILFPLLLITTTTKAFPTTEVHYENYQYEDEPNSLEDQSPITAYNRPCRHVLYPTYAGTGMDRLEDPLHDPKFTSTIRNYIRLRRHEKSSEQPEEDMETAASTAFVHQIPIRQQYVLTGQEPTQQLYEIRQQHQQPQFVQQQQQPQFVQQQPQFVQQQQPNQFVMPDPKYYAYLDGLQAYKPMFGHLQELPQFQQVHQQPATVMFRQPHAGNILVVDYPTQLHNSLYSNQDKKVTVLPKPTNQVIALKPTNLQLENKSPIYLNHEFDPVVMANRMNKQAEEEAQNAEQNSEENTKNEQQALTKEDRARLELMIKQKNELELMKDNIKTKEIPAMKDAVAKMLPKAIVPAPKMVLKEIEQVKIPANVGEPAKIIEKIQEVDVQLPDDKPDAITDEKLKEIVDLNALGTA